jgi:hypothetical protein
VHNKALIAAHYLTIVFSVLVATLFGADFFFLLFWPARTYPRWYNNTKQLLAMGITAGVGLAVVMSTVSRVAFMNHPARLIGAQVVVFRGAERISGVSAEQAAAYTSFFSKPPTGMFHTFHLLLLMLSVGLSSLPQVGCQRCLRCAPLDRICVHMPIVSILTVFVMILTNIDHAERF